MLPTERIAYSAITDRPRARSCRAARGMAVWVIVNVEEWESAQTMPRTVLTPPAGGSPIARHSELGLARIRQPRRLLAHAQGVRRVRDSRRAGDQRLGASQPIQPIARPRWSASGSSWATASPSTTCRRWQTSAPTSARPPRRSRKSTGKRAARLARARPDRNLGDARPPGRGRLRLRLRLGAGRPAGLAEDAHASRSSTCPTRRNATTSR